MAQLLLSNCKSQQTNTLSFSSLSFPYSKSISKSTVLPLAPSMVLGLYGFPLANFLCNAALTKNKILSLKPLKTHRWKGGLRHLMSCLLLSGSKIL